MKRIVTIVTALLLLSMWQCHKPALEHDAPAPETTMSSLEREAESLQISLQCRLQEAEKRNAYRPDRAEMRAAPERKAIIPVSSTELMHSAAYNIPE